MPKLPKGMFKRGNSFYTRIFENGGDRWLSLGTDYQEACRRLTRIRSGKETVQSRLTVSKSARQWLERYIATNRNLENIQLATRRVEMYLNKFLGWRLVGKVAPDDLREYRLWLEKKDLSPQSVAHILSDARCYFNWAEDSGLIAKAPIPKRLLPRIPESRPKFLTDEEVVILDGLPDPFGSVCRLGLGTGLRWAELTRAQRSDIQDGMLVVSHGKNGKIRRVPLSPSLLAELQFRVGKLVPFSKESCGYFARAVIKLSGIEGFHAHRLRHTFATRWASENRNLMALQKIMGHSTIVTTQRYAKLTDELVKAEALRELNVDPGTNRSKDRSKRGF